MVEPGMAKSLQPGHTTTGFAGVTRYYCSLQLVASLYLTCILHRCCANPGATDLHTANHVIQRTLSQIGLFAGYFLETTAVAPTIWTDSFPPNAAIEPVLPDPHKPNAPVMFREVFADDAQVCAYALQYKSSMPLNGQPWLARAVIITGIVIAVVVIAVIGTPLGFVDMATCPQAAIQRFSSTVECLLLQQARLAYRMQAAMCISEP